MDTDHNALPNGIDQGSYSGATTTISTIVLHRDPIEIVVALLQVSFPINNKLCSCMNFIFDNNYLFLMNRYRNLYRN